MNLGLFSLVLSRRWRGGSLTVLAFEPAEETYDLALKNLQRHQVAVIDHGATVPERLKVSEEGVLVHCFRLALGDRSGEEALCYFPYLTSSSTMSRHREVTC